MKLHIALGAGLKLKGRVRVDLQEAKNILAEVIEIAPCDGCAYCGDCSPGITGCYCYRALAFLTETAKRAAELQGRVAELETELEDERNKCNHCIHGGYCWNG